MVRSEGHRGAGKDGDFGDGGGGEHVGKSGGSDEAGGAGEDEMHFVAGLGLRGKGRGLVEWSEVKVVEEMIEKELGGGVKWVREDFLFVYLS